MNKRINKNSFIYFIEIYLLFLYIVLILLSYKEFIIWPQIEEHLSFSTFPDRYNIITELFTNNHPHAIRVSLIAPIFYLSDITSLDVKLIYNIYLILLLFFTYKLICKITINLIGYKSILFLLFLFLLSYFMNGRIIFAIFGNTLLLYLLYTNAYRKEKVSIFNFLLILLISVFFCSVSSGTLMVCLLTFFLFYFILLLVELPFIKRKFISIYILFALFIMFIFSIIFQLVRKNLDYYDNSILLMLNHGFGKYFILNEIILIFIILIIIAYFIFKFLKKNKKLILPLSQILASFSIGVFGFSSLVSGIMAYLLFIYLFIYRKENICQD